MATETEKTVQKEPPGITLVRDALDAHAGKLPEHGYTPERKPSGGEVMFDRVVYTGIGFGVNEISSLWITDQFVHGKPKWWLGGKAFSKEGFEAAGNFVAKKFNMPIGKAKNSILMATLLSGGTLLVLPIRALEENKIYWTKKANHFLDYVRGTKMTEEEVNARDEEVKQAVACSPQQTGLSLLVGRAVAMLTCWSTGSFLIGPKNNERIMDWSEKWISKGTKAVGLKKMAENETFKRYARLTGVETYSCLLSSLILEGVSKVFARRGKEVHDPEICEAYAKKARAANAVNAAPVSSSSDASAPAEKTECDAQKKNYTRESLRRPRDVITPSCSKDKGYSGKVQSDKESASPTLAV